MSHDRVAAYFNLTCSRGARMGAKPGDGRARRTRISSRYTTAHAPDVGFK